MESFKVAVIGGFKKESLEKKAKMSGDIDIAFHDGKLKHKNPEKVIEVLVKRSDYVVLMVDACSHQSMVGYEEGGKEA